MAVAEMASLILTTLTVALGQRAGTTQHHMQQRCLLHQANHQLDTAEMHHLVVCTGLYFLIFSPITQQRFKCSNEQALKRDLPDLRGLLCGMPGARLQHAPCRVLLAQRSVGALPLCESRAPALPAPGIGSARVQPRTAGSLESLPNQAFCYLAQVTAS